MGLWRNCKETVETENHGQVHTLLPVSCTAPTGRTAPQPLPSSGGPQGTSRHSSQSFTWPDSQHIPTTLCHWRTLRLRELQYLPKGPTAGRSWVWTRSVCHRACAPIS